MVRIGSLLLALTAASLGLGACVTETSDVLDWELSPDRADSHSGGVVFFHVQIKSKKNINSDMELQATAPAGFELALPTTLASTADEAEGEVFVPAGLDPGTYKIEVAVREEGGSWYSKSILLFISDEEGGEPDFSVELDPTSSTMEAGVGQTFTYYVRPLHGFLGTVEISLSQVGDDLVLSQGISEPVLTFSNSGGKGGTFVIRYEPHPPVASPVELTVTVSGGGVVHTRTLTLTLQTASSPS